MIFVLVSDHHLSVYVFEINTDIPKVDRAILDTTVEA